MSDPFLNRRDIGLTYKAKAAAGILSKKAFVGPYFAVIGDRYQCNYQCVFCEWFSPLVKHRRSQVAGSDSLSVDVYHKLVNELGSLGTKTILIGNIEEPFLDGDLLEKIKYTKQAGLKCFVITNGSLLNEENAEALVDLGLDYLNVSLNAAASQTYPQIHTTETEETFRRIVSMLLFIEKAKAVRGTDFPHVRISMVVCNRNYHDVIPLVELCHNIGVKNILIKRFTTSTKEIAENLELTPSQEEETKNSLTQAQHLARRYNITLDLEWSEWTDAQKTPQKDDLPCYFGWLFSVIDADGNVYPCCFQNRTPNSSMGNVKDHGFKTIWHSEKYKQFREQSTNIDARRQMGYLCSQPSCFFNNKQVYDSLHPRFLRHK